MSRQKTEFVTSLQVCILSFLYGIFKTLPGIKRFSDFSADSPCNPPAGVKTARFLRGGVFFVLIFFTAARAALAAQSIVQTFYIPITEDQIRSWEMGIANSNNGPVPINDTTVNDVISITATMDNTLIYYDQWEDGYEADISNPKQSTTQIWGDGNISNGAPPGCSSNSCDVINAGTVVSLQNSVPLVQSAGSYVRDQGNMYYDARDKIAATGQLVITRSGWLTPTGTVLSGAIEILDTRTWGTSFTVPVGIDSDNSVSGIMFSYAALSIMAGEDGTGVQVGGNSYTLDQGESIYIPDVTYGTQITSSAPVQVDVMTGTLGTYYEGRWFTLIPQDQWTNSYYCPATTVNTGDPAAALLYNPGSSDITVNVALAGGGSATVNVPAHNIARYDMPSGSAAHFYTTGNPAPDFFAIFINDFNNQNYEWASMMIPETSLTPSVVVGWAPGYDMSYNAPSPPDVDVVWVTPVSDTTVYVNYSGDPTVGAHTDSYGNKYDESYTVGALESLKISDSTDHDMTGARIYTLDGTRIAAFWGEDASTGVTGTPGMDIGTAILPYPTLTAYKTAKLIGDYNSNGGIDPGELVEYTVRVHNSGIFPITNIVLKDTLDPNVTYVAGTTGYSDSEAGPYIPVADNPLGTSPLEGGFTLVSSPNQLDPGQDMYVTFHVTVKDPLPDGVASIKNTITATSTSLQHLTVINEIFVNHLSSLVEQGALTTVKTSNVGDNNTVEPGDTINYTITVTNNSSTPQSGITISDPLPAGSSYVAGSTTATGHLRKYVKDMFNELSYGNNDGPQDWSGDWTENDSSGSSQDPLSGNVQVVNGSLRLTRSGSEASRQADLTTGIAGQSFTSATLSFDYRTSPSVTGSDAVQVQVYGNGHNWTTLGTISGIDGQTTGSESYDISSYIGADTALRFRVSNGYRTTSSDYFYADNVTVKTGELAVAVTKDNTAPGSDHLTNGVPPSLVTPADGFSLAPGETLTVNYSLQVDNPVTATRVTNTVNTTSYEQSQPAAYTTINPIDQGGAIGGTVWLDSVANGVIDTGEPGLYNVTVTLRDSGGNEVASTITGTDGTYLFSGLPLDNYSVSVDTPPLGLTLSSASNPVGVDLTDTTLYPDNKAAGINFGYNNGSGTTSIVGDYVWSDANNDGIQDPGEAGLGGVTMELVAPGGDGAFGTGDDVVAASATTNAFGTYLFTDVSPGEYIVRADASGMLAGYTSTFGRQSAASAAGSNVSNPFTVDGGYSYLMMDFGFHNASTYSVSDRVWFDLNDNGSQDPGEPGIGGITVSLLDSAGEVAAATVTDVYGDFTFSGLTGGNYTVRITDGNQKLVGFSGTTAAAQSAGLAVSLSGSDVSGIHFGYNAPGRIGYRVWNDVNGNGLQDPGENGISNVEVSLYLDTNGDGILETGTDQLVSTTTTDSAGDYMFQVADAGRYFVSVPDGASLSGLVLTTDDSQPAAGYQETVNFLDLYTSDMTANFGFNSGGLIGTSVWNDANANGVRDPGEEGIQGVTVRLYKSASGTGTFDPSTDTLVSTTTTDSSGSYSFDLNQLAKGTGYYFVSVDDTNPSLATMTLTTSDDQAAEGVQQTVNVTDAGANYLTANFGFYVPESDLAVTKTASPSGPVSPGQTITYTITITNNSSTTQTGINVEDPLPPDTTYVNGSALVTGYASAQVSLPDDADTYLYEGSSGNDNYGSSDPLQIRHSGRYERRALVHFNLSSIPPGAAIDSATMQFNVTQAAADITSINLYRLTGAWIENSATWDRYDGTHNWTTAGGDYDSGTLVGSFVPDSTGSKTVSTTDLASLVGNWLNGAAANDGVILIAQSGSNNSDTAYVNSRENGTAGNRPQLIVDYSAIVNRAPTVTYPSGSTLVPSSDGFSLAPGQSMTVTYQVVVGGAPDVSRITNIVTVSSDQSSPAKALAANTLQYNADLQVTKTISNYDSAQVTYSITVTNVGSQSESNVHVVDAFDSVTPGMLTCDPSGNQNCSSSTATQGSISYDPGANTVTWDVGSLAPSGSATLTLIADLTGPSGASATNCANLDTVINPPSAGDSNSGNDVGCVSMAVPTHVVLSGFGAYEKAGHVVITWQTSSENDTAGFYLLRRDESTGRFIPVNDRLLPGLFASPQGGKYALTDNGAVPGRPYTYVLVEVEGRGSKTAYGPFTVQTGESAANLGVSNTLNPSGLLAGGGAKESGDTTERHFDKNGTLVISVGARAMVSGGAKASGGFSDYTRTPWDTHAVEASDTSAARPGASSSRLLRQGERLKIMVPSDGLYFVSADEISQALGIPLPLVRRSLRLTKLGGAVGLLRQMRLTKFALSNRGRSVAYLPAGDGSGLYFFGQGMTGNYTRDNAYWLDPGRGVTVRSLQGEGPQPAGQMTFEDTVHEEKDLLVVPDMASDPEEDYWFWGVVVGGDPAYGAESFSFDVHDVSSARSEATMTVHLHGFTDTGHHAVIVLNGTTIGEGSWSGSDSHDVAVTFDQSLLRSGTNTVTVTGLLDTGVSLSIFYVDSFDISYQRLYRAVGNALFLKGEANPVVTVSGFTAPDILVFDVTDPQSPVLDAATSVGGAAGNYEVSFAPASPTDRYLAVSAGAASTGAASSVEPSHLSSPANAADYVIITPAEFAATAQSLADYRKSQGFSPMVVELEDVMNEFNFGISNPSAIRDFLDYAYTNWKKPPKYVVLAGKGTYDYKDNLGFGDNFVPPIMGTTPEGLAPADNLFADFGADHVPEIAIGRLPAVTPQELQNMIDKIIAYEENEGNRIVMAADVPDDGGDFTADSEEVAQLIPANYDVTKIYLSDYGTSQARQMLMSEINGGAKLLNYVGHGGVNVIAREGLLTTGDVASMTNTDSPNLLLAMTCVVGQFAIPGYETLGETMLANQGSGAAGIWAPTGLALDDLSHILDKSFFSSSFSGGRPTLGDLILKSLGTYSSYGGPSYIMDIYTLLGDPAMRVW